MRIALWPAVLGILALSVPVGHAQDIGFEEACASIGDMVRQRDDDVVVQHRGRTTPAVVFKFLACGDVVEVRNGASATVHLPGNQTAFVNAQQPRFSVPGENPVIANNSFLDKVRGVLTPIFKAPKRAIPVETIPRTGPSLRHDPFLPAVRQQWTGGAPGIAVLWYGGASSVEVFGSDGRSLRKVDTDGNRSAWVGLGAAESRSAGRVVVRDRFAPERTIAWDLVQAPAAPMPPWLAGNPRNDGELLLLLLWLLDEKPEWRLDALSRLAILASRSFPADRIWHAVRAGELTPN